MWRDTGWCDAAGRDVSASLLVFDSRYAETSRPAASDRDLDMASIISINTSQAKGERKIPVGTALLRVGHGVVGDGHAGNWHRQVSLLARESIESMRAKGLDVGPGDFAENITTGGINLPSLPLGTHIRLGAALAEVTQIGKECHDRCEIFRQAGDCVMPREGIFARVLEGGSIHDGDTILVVGGSGQAAIQGLNNATSADHSAAINDAIGGSENSLTLADQTAEKNNASGRTEK